MCVWRPEIDISRLLQLLDNSSIAVNLLFKTGSLTGACGLSESGWPASPRDSPVSASRVLGFSVTRYCRGEGVEFMAK